MRDRILGIKARRLKTSEGRQGRTQARGMKLLFVALICLLVMGTFLTNVVALLLGDRYALTVDLTANAAFVPGEETKALLQNLDRDVDIYVLATEDAFGGSSYLLQAQRMIEQYPKLSSRVRLTYVDYVTDPAFAARFPDLTLSHGDVLVVSGDRLKQIQLSDLFNYTSTQSGRTTILSSRAEEAVSSAILSVVSENQVRVAVLTGNGMADLPAFTRLLTENNFALASVNLTMDELDDSYDLALLLGPRIDLSEEALDKLDAFLYNDGQYGKTLFYTADVAQDYLPNLVMFLKEWGIEVGDGAVFETVGARTYQYQPYYPVVDYVDEAYRDRLIDPSAPVLMPLGRPLTLLFEARDTNLNEVLLQYADTAGVRPAEAVDSFTVEQTERWGPIPALVLASKHIYGPTGETQFRSNIVVSASTAMLDSYSIENTSLANSEYVLDLINTLTERQDVVNVQPKSLAGNTLSITTTETSTLGILLAGVLPLAVLVTGIVIWLARRYQ